MAVEWGFVKVEIVSVMVAFNSVTELCGTVADDVNNANNVLCLSVGVVCKTAGVV